LQYINRHGRVYDAMTEADISVDRQKASVAYLAKYFFLTGTVWVRRLADHSPINYLSGVTGLRS
jgi:hypothetical protein